MPPIIVPEIAEADETQNDGPQKKKTKTYENTGDQKAQKAELLKLVYLREKTVKDVNLVLSMTDCDLKLEVAGVEASLINEKLSVTVNCPLCNIRSVQKCNKYTVECGNYKRHFTSCHLEKGAKLEPGVKIKVVVDRKDQPSVSDFFKSKNAEPGKEANEASETAETDQAKENIDLSDESDDPSK